MTDGLAAEAAEGDVDPAVVADELVDVVVLGAEPASEPQAETGKTAAIAKTSRRMLTRCRKSPARYILRTAESVRQAWSG